MNKDYKIALLVFLLWAAPITYGASHSGSILYRLTAPIGFDSAGESGNSENSLNGQLVGTGTLSGQSHAVLWSSTGSATDLHPTNLTNIVNSYAYGNDGNQQVGYGTGISNGDALLWNSSAASAVDLNPTQFGKSIYSSAVAVGGGCQVGNIWTDSISGHHACLWNGSAESVVDLNPVGDIASYAYGTDGASQVGESAASYYHATLWEGTAASAVDLNPASLGPYASSCAYGVSGNQQVGEGFSNATGETHAFLWTGSASSAVDLTPQGFNSAIAYATNGAEQVGAGFGTATFGNYNHALLWTGSAASVIDLQDLLPTSGIWIDSAAQSVDSAGDVFGTADGIVGGVDGTFAVEWPAAAVPEPASLGLIAFAALFNWPRTPKAARSSS